MTKKLKWPKLKLEEPYEVLWKDASSQAGWWSGGDVKNYEDPICVTLGYFKGYNKDGSAAFGATLALGDRQVSNLQNRPRKMIIAIREVKAGKKLYDKIGTY